MEDTIKLIVLVSASADFQSGRRPYYWVCEEGRKADGWLKIADSEITVTRPKAGEIIPVQVAAFRSKIQQTRAEAEIKVRELQEQLENLLAISHSPSTAE